MTFIDVDSLDIMRQKRLVVSSTTELHAPLTNLELFDKPPLLLRSNEYCQVACELTCLEDLETSLSTVTSLVDADLFFLADVSLSSMNVAAADALLRKSARSPDPYLCDRVAFFSSRPNSVTSRMGG